MTPDKVSPQPSILLVDDEALIRKTLTRELRAEHFTVTALASGSDAISALQNAQYDVVITDLMMEGIDGFGVLKAVKKLAPLTRVIIISGYGDFRTAIDALRLGADDFTVKPFEVEELIFRVGRCLEKRSLLQGLMEKTLQLEEEIARRRLNEEKLLAETIRLFESFLDRLKKCNSPEQQQVLADNLRANINELISPCGDKPLSKNNMLFCLK